MSIDANRSASLWDNMAQLIQSIRPDIPESRRRGDQEKKDGSGSGNKGDLVLRCLMWLTLGYHGLKSKKEKKSTCWAFNIQSR